LNGDIAMTIDATIYRRTVILSGVFPDEGGKNAVEGSGEISRSGELPEILRLRNPTLARQIASLRMTV
jgi:hypothetical protein